MTGEQDTERRARVALSCLAQPGDLVLGAALRTRTADDLLTAVSGLDWDGEAVLSDQVPDPALARALPRWRDRLGELPSVARLAGWQQDGLRVIIPGDAEWPSQLDDPGAGRSVVLWARGTADLRFACLNSVSMVGSRAATVMAAMSQSRWLRAWQRLFGDDSVVHGRLRAWPAAR